MNREQLLKDVEKTVTELLQTLSAFNDNTFNTVPFEGSWTAGQVTEHVLKSSGVSVVLSGRTAPAERDPEQYIAPLREQFLNFGIKMTSPDFILPSEGPHDKQALMQELTDVWKKTVAIAETQDLSALCLDFEMPMVGAMTRKEWISFLSVHTQRHTHQLKNILKALKEPAL